MPSANDSPSLLPYAEASPWQRHQALLSARQVLDAAYSFLSQDEWVQALDQMQPALQFLADQIVVSYPGLATLVYYLETHYRPAAAAAPGALPIGNSSPAGMLPAGKGKQKKQTYAVYADLLTQLARVSYWRRRPISQLVNEALAQLLRQYPEAHQPVPET